MAKDKKLFSKIVMIVFMLLIVVGFTVPLFNLGGNTNENGYVEPRLCQSDPDCYLTCDDLPVKVMCSQNLCVQNACDEYNLYPYQEESLTFMLKVEVEGEKIYLADRGNSLDFFTRFEEEEVQIFTSDLPLGDLFSRIGISLNTECLVVGSKAYCQDDEKELSLSVNGEDNYQFNNFVPQEGDVVEVVYS